MLAWQALRRHAWQARPVHRACPPPGPLLMSAGGQPREGAAAGAPRDCAPGGPAERAAAGGVGRVWCVHWPSVVGRQSKHERLPACLPGGSCRAAGRQGWMHGLTPWPTRSPPSPCRRAAHRLYKIALQRGFTRGRRTAQVAAACLYLVCRQDSKPFLLIDFSDALQVGWGWRGTCGPGPARPAWHAKGPGELVTLRCPSSRCLLPPPPPHSHPCLPRNPPTRLSRADQRVCAGRRLPAAGQAAAPDGAPYVCKAGGPLALHPPLRRPTRLWAPDARGGCGGAMQEWEWGGMGCGWGGWLGS